MGHGGNTFTCSKKGPFGPLQSGFKAPSSMWINFQIKVNLRSAEDSQALKWSLRMMLNKVNQTVFSHNDLVRKLWILKSKTSLTTLWEERPHFRSWGKDYFHSNTWVQGLPMETQKHPLFMIYNPQILEILHTIFKRTPRFCYFPI